MRKWVNLVPPKDMDPRLVRMFKQIDLHMDQSQSAVANIGRGVSPDGGSIPLFDSSGLFKLAGRDGGQLAYGATEAGGKLVLSSTAGTSKGKIYFGSSQTQAAFDESSGSLGVGTVSPAALLHLYDVSANLARLESGTFTVVNCTLNGTITATTTASFVPVGGPRVVPGMFVSSSDGGIPVGTQVQHLNSGTIMLLTAPATTSGSPVTLTFQTYVDIGPISDETGRDVQFTVRGAVRFTTGTASVPLRITGDREAIATSVSASPRVYLETGTISGGVATGTDFQIGGPGHGDLRQLNIRASNVHFDEPASGSVPNVGVSLNPAEYNASTGPDVNLTVFRTAGSAGLSVVSSGSSTDPAFSVLPFTAIGGLSPNKTLSQSFFSFKVTEDGRVWVGNSFNGGSYMTGSPSSLNVFAGGTGLNLFSPNAGIASWSDSAVSLGVYVGDASGTSANRIWFSSAGNGALDRVGFGSKYHLIANAQAGNTDFLAPSANPEVLQVVNSSSANGNDASPLLVLNTKRSAQTGDMLQTLDSAGNVLFAVRGKGHLKMSQATAPTIAAGAALGTSPTVAVTTASTDTTGSVQLTTGLVPIVGVAATITFNSNYSAAPKSVLISPSRTGAAALHAYVSSTSTSTFVISFDAAPVASTRYDFTYWVVE